MAKHELEPSHHITPQMVRETFKVLEERGMFHMDEGTFEPDAGWKMASKKSIKEEIIAYGHPNVTGTHTTTFEITKAADLGKEGSCVIAVKSDKACADLSKEFRNALKKARKLEITLEAEGVVDKIIAYGSPALKLTHPEDMVVRTSDFIDSRTLAILSDKSANEIKQDLIEVLRKPETKLKITLEIK